MGNVIHSYENKIVAITGARGYLASALTDAFLQASVRILRISRKDLPSLPGAETLKADICKRECWEKIVQSDVIFHFAGNTSVYTAAKDPAESLNSTVLPITHLIAAAEARGRSLRVVFASTATVYGLTGNLPVAEDVEPKPITNYDLHKLFAEKQLELAAKQGILEGVSLRLANVYGPSSSASSADDRGILNRIARLALQGVNLQLYGGGDYLRDYIYIDDVVRAFMFAGVKEGVAGQSFNVATGKSITVREAFHLVADRAERVTGKRVQVGSTPWPDEADAIEFRNFVADITSIQNFAGWSPTISLCQGVDRLIECFCSKN
ncbi:MAG: GDP-6-deoxy-D-mannose reductase [Nitrosomonadaceae bacterium]|nr:GDP-6-deoxy-D-mannose reductase [Nitrosomonadaceae bacterium]